MFYCTWYLISLGVGLKLAFARNPIISNPTEVLRTAGVEFGIVEVSPRGCAGSMNSSNCSAIHNQVDPFCFTAIT